jgi:hypothetical protein
LLLLYQAVRYKLIIVHGLFPVLLENSLLDSILDDLLDLGAVLFYLFIDTEDLLPYLLVLLDFHDLQIGLLLYLIVDEDE